jgi:GTP pyrophosphokinase
VTKSRDYNLEDLLALLDVPDASSIKLQVRKAYEFAEEAHGGLLRQSGERYIDHDLALAVTVTNLGVDPDTVTACLLHDTLLHHTDVEQETIQAIFGEEVANLVNALGKLLPYTNKHHPEKDDRALEAIRRAILTIVEGDMRVILIHLADRLEDLRRAINLPGDIRLKLAMEARDIHAPLANRLGIWQLKWELEDLAFRYTEPDHYHRIAGQLDERRTERDRRIDIAAEILRIHINEASIQAEITGRPKHIYSIYRKMGNKGVNLEQIYDIRALRVIIEDDEPNFCYQVLGIVHNLWQPIPNEFDDYIARAKPNGYQSLHTAVIDDKGQTLEVQIRTRSMHEEAERGIAAHWAYKEVSKRSSALSQRVNWLRQLLSSLQDTVESSTDDESFKKELLGERIYVFTPNGDVIDLPKGSTPIDFAYAIHTEVGHRCRGARVNGKMVGLDYKLQSGEKVDIITAKKGGPNRDWMNDSLGFTASNRTRSKVRRWFRLQEKDMNISQGREVVNRELKRLGVLDVYSPQDIAQALKYEEVDIFLAQVGFGDIQSAKIGGAIALLQQRLQPDDELGQLIRGQQQKSSKLTVLGVEGLHTRMARCCNPIPPEPILGYITRGRGVTIHTQHCKQLLATKEPERWIDVEWGLDEETFPIPIVVTAYRRSGLMEDIANILRGQNIHLSKTKNISIDGGVKVHMVAGVSSLDQLNWILSKMEKLPNVIEARRQRWAD